MSFASCKGTKPLPEVAKDFTAVATIHSQNLSEDYILKAEVTVENASAFEINVTSPEDLAGLSYLWNADEFEMVYDELHCKAEVDYLPEFGFAQIIRNVLCSVYENPCGEYTESGDVIFAGKCVSGGFELLTDNKGKIRNISVEELNFSADFE